MAKEKFLALIFLVAFLHIVNGKATHKIVYDSFSTQLFCFPRILPTIKCRLMLSYKYYRSANMSKIMKL